MALNNKPASPVSAAVDDRVLVLLQHVAESEHHLRHPAAFAKLIAALGLALDHDGSRWVVSDPKASKAASEK